MFWLHAKILTFF